MFVQCKVQVGTYLMASATLRLEPEEALPEELSCMNAGTQVMSIGSRLESLGGLRLSSHGGEAYSQAFLADIGVVYEFHSQLVVKVSCRKGKAHTSCHGNAHLREPVKVDHRRLQAVSKAKKLAKAPSDIWDKDSHHTKGLVGFGHRQTSVGIRKIVSANTQIQPRIFITRWYGKTQTIAHHLRKRCNAVNVDRSDGLKKGGLAIMACLPGIVNYPEFAIRLFNQETFEGSPVAPSKLVIKIPSCLEWTTELAGLFLLCHLKDLFMISGWLGPEDPIHCLNCGLTQPVRHRRRFRRRDRAKHATGSKLTNNAIALDQVLGLGQVWPTQEHRHDCQESRPLGRSHLFGCQTSMRVKSFLEWLNCSRHSLNNVSKFSGKSRQNLSPGADSLHYKSHIRFRPRPVGKGGWERGRLAHVLLRSQTWRQEMVKTPSGPRWVSLATKACINSRTVSSRNGDWSQKLPIHTLRATPSNIVLQAGQLAGLEAACNSRPYWCVNL